ncbi:hypothetical protein PMAYCL1PPCAC_23837, partial [Pristionchus mayeri]
MANKFIGNNNLGLSRSLLKFGEFHLDQSVSGLLGAHQLEAVEVGESRAKLAGSELLGPGASLPLLGNFSLGPRLLDVLGSLLESNGDLELGQLEVLQVTDATENSGSGSIEKNLITVDDVDDGREFALVIALSDIDNTADFYHAF